MFLLKGCLRPALQNLTIIILSWAKAVGPETVQTRSRLLRLVKVVTLRGL